MTEDEGLYFVRSLTLRYSSIMVIVSTDIFSVVKGRNYGFKFEHGSALPEKTYIPRSILIENERVYYPILTIS